MSRKSIAILIVTIAASFGSAADAGCNKYRCSSGYNNYRHNYSRSYSYNYVRPVRHVNYAPIHSAPTIVAPLPVEQLPSAQAGSTITLPANFLGNQPGSVFMVFNNIKLPVTILNWSNNGVTIKLPPMAIRTPVKIRLDAILPHGAVGLTQKIIVIPPASVILHPTNPTPQLPTNAALAQQGLLQN